MDYLVTSKGDVYSYKPRCYRTHKGPRILKKLKPSGVNDPLRYLSVHLSKGNKVTTREIHRLVGKYFVDGYFEGAVIDHKDRNKHNNDCENLEWVTQRENIHRSYCVMDQVRNYKNWVIVHPDGEQSGILKGYGEILRYITNNNLPILISMLTKHKVHNGFRLIEAVS